MNRTIFYLRAIAAILTISVLVPALSGCTTKTTVSTESAAENFSVQSNYTISRQTRDNYSPMGPTDTWTIFIYMCGTDLESENALASFNLQTLMNGPDSDNVRYIVQTGGTKQWGTGDAFYLLEEFGIEEFTTRALVDPNKLQRWEITDTMTLLDEQELAPMSDPDTLADFLTWGVENYPAEKMGVAFWDHGGGSIGGLIVDELFDQDIMSLLELEAAFDEVYESMTDKFEFVAFDACLMGSIEIANILAPHARYMYASEEVIDGFGWGDYSVLTKAINKNPSMDGAELGTILCNEYFDFYRELEAEDTVTYSVVDLEKINNVLYALNNMAIELKDASANPAYFAEISRGVHRTENYYFQFMVDLGDLAGNLTEIAPTSCQDLQRAIKEAVVHSVSGGSRAFASGLSVFYPNSEANTNYLAKYGLTPATPDYLAYVSDLIFKKSRYTALGREFVQVTQEPYITEDGRYSMSIDISTYDYVQALGFYLFYDLENGKCALYGFDDDVEFDPDTGVITDDFVSKWASIDGVPFFLTLINSSPEYNLYHSPIVLNGKDTFLVMQWLWNESEPDNGHYEILGTWSGIDPYTRLASRETRQLEPGDHIIPRYVIISKEDVLSDELIEDTSEFMEGNHDIIYTEGTDSVTYYPDTKMEHALLQPGEYYYQFIILDVYDRPQTYVPIGFTVSEDGVAVAKTVTQTATN